MSHKQMISHLCKANCGTCLTSAVEFERIIKKNWELRQELKKHNHGEQKEGEATG